MKKQNLIKRYDSSYQVLPLIFLFQIIFSISSIYKPDSENLSERNDNPVIDKEEMQCESKIINLFDDETQSIGKVIILVL